MFTRDTFTRVKLTTKGAMNGKALHFYCEMHLLRYIFYCEMNLPQVNVSRVNTANLQETFWFYSGIQSVIQTKY